LNVKISDEKSDDDVDEESELAGNVKEEDLLRQASEEAELHGSEEGRVHRPYQNEMLPHYVPPAFFANNIAVSEVRLSPNTPVSRLWFERYLKHVSKSKISPFRSPSVLSE